MMSVLLGLCARENEDVGRGQTTKIVASAVRVLPVEKGRGIVIVIMNVKASFYVGLKTAPMARTAMTVAQPSKFKSLKL